MLSIKPTYEQKEYAWQEAQTLAFGRRGRFDGDATRQYAGILGQVVTADALGMKRPAATDGFDGGVDFVISGRKVDQKTILLTHPPQPHWANNLYTGQIHFSLDAYLFASCVKSEGGKIYYHGFMPKDWATNPRYFHAKGEKRPRGKAEPLILPVDTIEVPTTELWTFQSFEELADKLTHL